MAPVRAFAPAEVGTARLRHRWHRQLLMAGGLLVLTARTRRSYFETPHAAFPQSDGEPATVLQISNDGYVLESTATAYGRVAKE
jgi:hypothetical protein